MFKKFIKQLGYVLSKKDAQGWAVRHDENGKPYRTAPIFSYETSTGMVPDWNSTLTVLSRKDVKNWVKALRSGEYRQTKGRLYRETEGYCCLGVLAKEQGCLNDGFFTIDNKKHSQSDLQLNDYTSVFIPIAVQGKYMRINDSGNYSFSQIADQIEKDFDLV